MSMRNGYMHVEQKMDRWMNDGAEATIVSDIVGKNASPSQRRGS